MARYYIINNGTFDTGLSFTKQSSSGYKVSISNNEVIAYAYSGTETNEYSSIYAIVSKMFYGRGQTFHISSTGSWYNPINASNLGYSYSYFLYDISAGSRTTITDGYTIPNNDKQYYIGVYVATTSLSSSRTGEIYYKVTVNNMYLDANEPTVHINPIGKGTTSIVFDGNKITLTAIKKATTKFQNWLVNGYTQLEYIESSGTQYIDTSFKPNGNSRVVFDGYVGGADQAPFAILNGSYTYGVNDESGTPRFRYFGQQQTIGSSIRSKKLIELDKNVAKLDNTTIYSFTLSSSTSPINLYLMARNNSGTADWKATGKCYSFKAYDNDVLSLNLIPVIRHSDGQIGMLDLVHFKFYGNSGSGYFLAGGIIQ